MPKNLQDFVKGLGKNVKKNEASGSLWDTGAVESNSTAVDKTPPVTGRVPREITPRVPFESDWLEGEWQLNHPSHFPNKQPPNFGEAPRGEIAPVLPSDKRGPYVPAPPQTSPSYEEWWQLPAQQGKRYPTVMVPDPRGGRGQVDFAFAEYLKATGQAGGKFDGGGYGLEPRQPVRPSQPYPPVPVGHQIPPNPSSPLESPGQRFRLEQPTQPYRQPYQQSQPLSSYQQNYQSLRPHPDLLAFGESIKNRSPRTYYSDRPKWWERGQQ